MDLPRGGGLAQRSGGKKEDARCSSHRRPRRGGGGWRPFLHSTPRRICRTHSGGSAAPGGGCSNATSRQHCGQPGNRPTPGGLHRCGCAGGAAGGTGAGGGSSQGGEWAVNLWRSVECIQHGAPVPHDGLLPHLSCQGICLFPQADPGGSLPHQVLLRLPARARDHHGTAGGCTQG